MAVKKTATKKKTAKKVKDTYDQTKKYMSEMEGMSYGGFQPLTAEEKKMQAEIEKRRGKK